MIDTHSHIIFGVDDGPETMEDSLSMISEAAKAGIKIIFATPHYHKGIFENGKMEENLNKLVQHASELEVTLLPGYEVNMDPLLPMLMEERSTMTLNRSRYLLLELPFGAAPEQVFETLFRLQTMNLILIIAHPETNRAYYKNFDLFMGLLERGCLIQLSAASIAGVYGFRVKRFAKKLIKLNMAHFVASDAHNAKDYSRCYTRAYRIVHRWAGEKYADKLFTKNATVILENRNESIYEMI